MLLIGIGGKSADLNAEVAAIWMKEMSVDSMFISFAEEQAIASLRHQQKNYSVHAAVSKLLEDSQPEIAVIIDVEFIEDAAFIKEKDGVLVEVLDAEGDGESVFPDYLGWNFIIRVKASDHDAIKIKAKGVLDAILSKNILYPGDAVCSDSVPDSTGHSST